jgi:hypothetical protein
MALRGCGDAAPVDDDVMALDGKGILLMAFRRDVRNCRELGIGWLVMLDLRSYASSRGVKLAPVTMSNRRV